MVDKRERARRVNRSPSPFVVFERRLFRFVVDDERRRNGQPDVFTVLFRRRLRELAERADRRN